MDSVLQEILVILALILANGIFAGSEIALISLRKTRVAELASEGRRGRAIQTLRDDPERLLATIQVGVTVISSTAAAFGGARLSGRLAPVLEPVAGRHAPQLALALVITLVSYLSLVLGELVPKSLALRGAEGYAGVVARPLLGLTRLARPLVWLLTASSNAVLRLFGDRTSFSEGRLSSEELHMMVDEATRHGTIDPRAGEIASRALEFGDLDAQHVMVPRGAVVAVSRHASPDDLRQVLLEENHTRLPVFDESIDNIVGYVTAKDVLAMVLQKELIVLEDLIRPAYFVPERMPAVDLLHEMQRRRTQLAIVVDELGSFAGIVTTEDLVEELVGDILSEYDKPVDGEIQREPDGAILVPGTLPIRDANRELGLDLPEGEGFTTVAGLCIELAARIPAVGAHLDLPDGTALEVVEASAHRVRSVRIRPRPEEEPIVAADGSE
jgi:putative hemolysin